MSNAEPSGSRILSWILLLFVLAYSAWVGYEIVFRVPQFRKLFADLNTALPAPTIWLLSASSWLKWVVTGVAAFALVKQLLIRNRPFNLAVNGLLLIGLFIFDRLMTEAMLLPLTAVMWSVSGGHG